jgi:hypothetical protein
MGLEKYRIFISSKEAEISLLDQSEGNSPLADYQNKITLAKIKQSSLLMENKFLAMVSCLASGEDEELYLGDIPQEVRDVFGKLRKPKDGRAKPPIPTLIGLLKNPQKLERNLNFPNVVNILSDSRKIDLMLFGCSESESGIVKEYLASFCAVAKSNFDLRGQCLRGVGEVNKKYFAEFFAGGESSELFRAMLNPDANLDLEILNNEMFQVGLGFQEAIVVIMQSNLNTAALIAIASTKNPELGELMGALESRPKMRDVFGFIKNYHKLLKVCIPNFESSIPQLDNLKSGSNPKSAGGIGEYFIKLFNSLEGFLDICDQHLDPQMQEELAGKKFDTWDEQQVNILAKNLSFIRGLNEKVEIRNTSLQEKIDGLVEGSKSKKVAMQPQDLEGDFDTENKVLKIIESLCDFGNGLIDGRSKINIASAMHQIIQILAPKKDLPKNESSIIDLDEIRQFFGGIIPKIPTVQIEVENSDINAPGLKKGMVNLLEKFVEVVLEINKFHLGVKKGEEKKIQIEVTEELLKEVPERKVVHQRKSSKKINPPILPPEPAVVVTFLPPEPPAREAPKFELNAKAQEFYPPSAMRPMSRYDFVLEDCNYEDVIEVAEMRLGKDDFDTYRHQLNLLRSDDCQVPPDQLKVLKRLFSGNTDRMFCVMEKFAQDNGGDHEKLMRGILGKFTRRLNGSDAASVQKS